MVVSFKKGRIVCPDCGQVIAYDTQLLAGSALNCPNCDYFIDLDFNSNTHGSAILGLLLIGCFLTCVWGFALAGLLTLVGAISHYDLATIALADEPTIIISAMLLLVLPVGYFLYKISGLFSASADSARGAAPLSLDLDALDSAVKHLRLFELILARNEHVHMVYTSKLAIYQRELTDAVFRLSDCYMQDCLYNYGDSQALNINPDKIFNIYRQLLDWPEYVILKKYDVIEIIDGNKLQFNIIKLNALLFVG